MMTPFHCTPNRISLTIQKYSNSTGSRKTGDQELIFTRYHDDIGIRYPIQLGNVNLRDGQDFREGHFGKIDETVCIRRRNGGA
jgi:hypothetical protein